MNKAEFLQLVKSQGEFTFSQVLDVIEDHYAFTSTEFKNGQLTNECGHNEGSAKVFAFAKLNELGQEETLSLFAEHYQSVLKDPQGDNHGNIRNFIETSWGGITFDQFPLTEK